MLTIDALPPPQQIEHVVMSEARTVYDIAGFHFTDYERDGVFSWALAVIIPEPDSGYASIPEGYINAETGAVVVPPEAEMVIMKKGKWKLLAADQPTHSAAGTYAWNEPIEQDKRILDPEDFYSPFVHGGTLLFQPNPSGKGIDQFQHPRMIFSQWKEMVQPAFAYSSKTGSVLDGGGTERDSQLLADLISQSNALLSALALRESLRLQSITPQSSRGLLHRADHRLKALFVYLMLTASSLDSRGDWLNQILQLAKETSRLEDLFAFGLGAFAATLFRYGDAEISGGGKTVLATVKKRLEILQVSTEKAPHLYYMVERLGVD